MHLEIWVIVMFGDMSNSLKVGLNEKLDLINKELKDVNIMHNDLFSLMKNTLMIDNEVYGLMKLKESKQRLKLVRSEVLSIINKID